jgi:hypothetical protein
MLFSPSSGAATFLGAGRGASAIELTALQQA